MSALFGATVIDDLQKVFQAALNDSKIKAIVLDVDSPGGTVSGIDAMCEVVLAARQIKPVVAFANSQMSSAAYWLGSAASVVVCERTASLGSIAPSTLEMSNVDLANEFVQLITTQRAFQANSKVITTSDDVLAELINIKR